MRNLKKCTMKKLNKKITALHEEIDRLLEARIEELARMKLRSNKNLKEFVMAMGTAFFIDKEGSIVDIDEEVYSNYNYISKPAKGFKQIYDFLLEYDHTYKVTGNPMRFTAEGPKITEW